MERQRSQREKILAWLKAKKSIAPLQALNMFGCMRLAQRIAEIENMGYEIEHKMIYEHPVKYCRYKLIRRKAA